MLERIVVDKLDRICLNRYGHIFNDCHVVSEQIYHHI
jgi:hypothetical protein